MAFAVIVAAGNVSPQGPAVSCQGFEIVSDELTREEAQKYCRFAVEERKKVEQVWGATWTDPIRIRVSSTYAIARSLLTNGGAPGNIEMPLARVRDGTGPLLHEITHNYAPDANRFLQEGLAVYLQDTMGANDGFPNFGRRLRVLAVQTLPSVRSLDSLNNVRFPQQLASVIPERAAYIVAGSFVKFLVDRDGLPRFRTLYESGNYEKAYQKPLRLLEAEWRASLPRR